MMDELVIEGEDLDSPFKNLTVYAEVNAQPMRFLLPPGAEEHLMMFLSQMNQGQPLVMEPLKEGSKVEIYEEPPTRH